MIDKLNKLCEWRTVLAGWHHGTRSINSPGPQAMRELMDLVLILRAEGNAVAALLIQKGVFTATEYTEQLQKEAEFLDQQMSAFFPGFRTSEVGIEIYDVPLARSTMARLGFPE